jgi:hypothetical protein
MSDSFRTDPASYDVRLGGLRSRSEIDRADIAAPVRGFRARIPTLAQLEALLENGKLMLPRRYFRGFFLDLFA